MRALKLAAVALCAWSCNAVFGVDDLSFGGERGSGGATNAPSSNTASNSSAGGSACQPENCDNGIDDDCDGDADCADDDCATHVCSATQGGVVATVAFDGSCPDGATAATAWWCPTCFETPCTVTSPGNCGHFVSLWGNDLCTGDPIVDSQLVIGECELLGVTVQPGANQNIGMTVVSTPLGDATCVPGMPTVAGGEVPLCLWDNAAGCGAGELCAPSDAAATCHLVDEDTPCPENLPLRLMVTDEENPTCACDCGVIPNCPDSGNEGHVHAWEDAACVTKDNVDNGGLCRSLTRAQVVAVGNHSPPVAASSGQCVASGAPSGVAVQALCCDGAMLNP